MAAAQDSKRHDGSSSEEDGALKLVHDNCRCEMRFRPIAIAFAVSFAVTVAASAVVTFKATHYSKETDKITLFYGVFNPCIFFDHYPAKVLATLGMGFVILLSVAFSALMMLHQYAGKQVFTVLWGGVIAGMMTIADCMFVNVFTTNLYPEVQPYRRLHGVHFVGNSTVTLIEQHRGGHELPPSDVQIILLHTVFYAVWVTAQIVYLMYTANVARHVRNWTKPWAITWVVTLSVYIVLMFLHVGGMWVLIMYGKGHVELEELSLPQKVVMWSKESAKTSLLGFPPIFLYRLVVGSSMGVAFTFRLQGNDRWGMLPKCADGEVCPNQFLGKAFCFIAFIGVAGSVFHSGLDDDETTRVFRLASVIRSKPFAYIAAPLYIFALFLVGAGCGLTLVQSRLKLGRWPALRVCLAAFLVSAMYGGMLLILEQERFTWVFGVIFLVSYVIWVLALSVARGQRLWITVVYLVAGVAVIIGSLLRSLICSFLFLAWLCLYEFVVPPGPKVLVTLERLVDIAKEASTTEDEETIEEEEWE